MLQLLQRNIQQLKMLKKQHFFCSDCDEIIDYPGISARIGEYLCDSPLESCNDQGSHKNENIKKEI